jgi:hypothetical protein
MRVSRSSPPTCGSRSRRWSASTAKLRRPGDRLRAGCSLSQSSQSDFLLRSVNEKSAVRRAPRLADHLLQRLSPLSARSGTREPSAFASAFEGKADMTADPKQTWLS